MNTGERLTWPQIRDLYPDQWVVLIDHDWDETKVASYASARVVAQGPSRAAAVANAQPALDAHRSWGCRYTGTIRGPMFQLKQFMLDR